MIPVMRAQGHGRIVQCSSVLGFVTLPWRGAYNATKFALEGLTDTMRIELRGTGIHVILIEPGPITSKIRQNSIPHFERWIDWQNSARRDQYEAKLTKRLYESRGPDRFELPAEAVVTKLRRAVTHHSPSPRYHVTTPTHLMGVLKRLLPTARWIGCSPEADFRDHFRKPARFRASARYICAKQGKETKRG